jgi:hypothetical protein
MKTATLDDVLANHKLWVSDSTQGVCADLCGADLRGAKLHGADLCAANLRGADLYRADLDSANLYRADLRGANLDSTNLHGANLCGANLCGANLAGANLTAVQLYRTIGDNVYVITMQLSRWCVTRTHSVMQIGCQRHTIEEWFTFDDATIDNMAFNALSWWRTHKPLIQLWIQSHPAKQSTGVQS